MTEQERRVRLYENGVSQLKHFSGRVSELEALFNEESDRVASDDMFYEKNVSKVYRELLRFEGIAQDYIDALKKEHDAMMQVAKDCIYGNGVNLVEFLLKGGQNNEI